ncbi:hypothetical protein GF376_04905, partial [Candidatus Peregrinibacteria bacterium]|nr:hypothetical protein [Candidatus Peregrinibacteria bacterium]
MKKSIVLLFLTTFLLVGCNVADQQTTENQTSDENGSTVTGTVEMVEPEEDQNVTGTVSIVDPDEMTEDGIPEADMTADNPVNDSESTEEEADSAVVARGNSLIAYSENSLQTSLDND